MSLFTCLHAPWYSTLTFVPRRGSKGKGLGTISRALDGMACFTGNAVLAPRLVGLVEFILEVSLVGKLIV